MEMFSEDMVHIKQKEAVGTKLGYAIDDLNQISMLSTTNRYYATDTLNPAIDNVGDDVTVGDGTDDNQASISYEDLKRIYNKLVIDGAEKVNELITGSAKVGTLTVESKYHMIIHQNHLSDLEALVDEHNRPAFIPVHQYAAGLKAQGMSLAPGEVGRIYQFVVIVSERAMHESAKGAEIPIGYTGKLKWGVSTEAVPKNRFDIYPILFPTKGSIAGVGLQGHMKPQFYYTGKETVAFDNLFRNKSAFAGKAWYASLITKPEGLLRYDVAVTN
jgi:N4-gp56 family major capsid protein